jgi:hypothetical protein
MLGEFSGSSLSKWESELGPLEMGGGSRVRLRSREILAPLSWGLPLEGSSLEMGVGVGEALEMDASASRSILTLWMHYDD